MNRQSWSCEEDEAITKLVAQYGFNDWTQIAQKLKETYNITKRTGKQCRERWYNHLNPAVNKKPWGNQEEELLFELHKVHGNRWKDISRYFLGRTDNDIKNHFYSTLRRSLRRLNKILGEKNSTSQMRQIKPSVLSTIMNYLYEQDNGQENDLYRSLRDLPSLIFEFANFKPIKTNLKFAKVEDAKTKISDIFELINRFNDEYETTKSIRLTSKHLKKANSRKDTVESIQVSPLENYKATEPNPQAFETIEKIPVDNKLSQSSRPGTTEQFEPNDILKQEEDEEFGIKHLVRDKYQEDIEEEADICNMGSINMSMIDEIELEEMKDPEQPSMLSKQGDALDLTVFGHHWQPQSWERSASMKEFVDEVLEINYEGGDREA